MKQFLPPTPSWNSSLLRLLHFCVSWIRLWRIDHPELLNRSAGTGEEPECVYTATEPWRRGPGLPWQRLIREKNPKWRNQREIVLTVTSGILIQLFLLFGETSGNSARCLHQRPLLERRNITEFKSSIVTLLSIISTNIVVFLLWLEVFLFYFL